MKYKWLWYVKDIDDTSLAFYCYNRWYSLKAFIYVFSYNQALYFFSRTVLIKSWNNVKPSLIYKFWKIYLQIYP